MRSLQPTRGLARRSSSGDAQINDTRVGRGRPPRRPWLQIVFVTNHRNVWLKPKIKYQKLAIIVCRPLYISPGLSALFYHTPHGSTELNRTAFIMSRPAPSLYIRLVVLHPCLVLSLSLLLLLRRPSLACSISRYQIRRVGSWSVTG